MTLLGMRTAPAVLGGLLFSACSLSAPSFEGHDGGASYSDSGGSLGTRDGAARTDGGLAPIVPPFPPPMFPPGDAGIEDSGLDRCAMRETHEPVVLYLSADDSNSMASPVIARSLINRGGANVPSWMLRTYEFLNYYNVPYPSPPEDHAGIVAELRTLDEAEGELTLQIGVSAAPRETIQPRVITLVLDRSGSMSGAPIDREREVVRALAHVLREGDLVSWVEWNTERTVRLEGLPVSGPDDATLLALVASLEADGGTDLDGGLRFGYELAERFYDPARLNRVVLISDGVANAGETSVEVIARNSEDAERDGIYLVGVGVGDGINDTLMDEVTDAGRGAYVYVDTADEARRMFEERFAETMEVGLLGVRVETTLPWYMAIREFHGEEYSVGDPEAVRPQHLSPGDAMVFHQTIAACDPALIDPADVVRVRATYTRPDGRIAAEDVIESTIGALLAQPDVGFVRGDAIVAYAEALAAISRNRESRGDGADATMRTETARVALQLALTDGANPDLAELPDLLEAAALTR
jgi:Ca-activated chloride channel family protein